MSDLALSVLVPTFGRGETLAALLERLGRQTLAAERFEVVVVDDGSPEPVTLEPAAHPFALTLLRQANAGPAAARNAGLERCRAPLVLILNDDALPAEDLLERHLAAHAEAPERCAVLGTFHFTQRALASPFVQLLDGSDLLFTFSKLRHGGLHPWQFFWTCNVSLPVEAIRAVGGFDAERFPEPIVEDVELGYRLERAGWRVLFREDCRAEHDHVLTPESFLRRAVRLGVNLHRMWERHGDPAILWERSEADVEARLAGALDVVEATTPVLEQLVAALGQLERQYAGRQVPEATRAQAVGLLRELGAAALHRGLHLARTGIDPVAVAEAGPPAPQRVSVVVVSYDALAKTRRCVEALRAARDGRFPTDLIVVDNGSRDGSAEWLAEQPDVELVRNASNEGAPKARNQGIERARGEWVAFLDNDVYVTPGWLERALYHGAVDPTVGAVCLVSNRGSKHQQVPYEGGSTPEEIAAHAERRAAEHRRRGTSTDLFTSFGVLVRRSVVDELGGFDERFSPWGFEDDDYSLRVRRAGYTNRVAHDVFVYHDHYDDPEKERRHAGLLRRNWERFAEKWGRCGPTPAMYDYRALDLLRPEGPQARPARLAEPAPGRRSVLVLGAGRSGTSLLAGTLAGAGWHVGDEPYPGRDSNPKGFFETAEVNGLNEFLLAAAGGEERPHGRMQRWLATPPPGTSFRAPAWLRARIARLGERRPFAYKDPRFCFTLPVWRRALGADVGLVCVFREPAVTAESVLEECASQPYLAGVAMDFERAVELWTRSYRSLLEERRRGGDWLFLHYDQLLTEEGQARLEAFVGGPVARDFPEAGLKRTRSARPVPEPAAALYRELCGLAGHEDDALPTSAPAEAASGPTGEGPELSVLVCTYQRRDTLTRCLASFERQGAPPGSYELVVVNDGSTDGTRDWLDAWSPALPHRVVHRQNGGLAAARNSGLAVARGELVLLVNDDTIAFGDLVERHLAAHRKMRGRSVAVQGTFEQPPGALENALMRTLEGCELVFCYNLMRPGALHDWNRFWTCNVSAPSAAVRAAGGFDERFRHYGCEDTDLALRLDAQGFQVYYEDRARAHHEHVLTLADLERRNRTTAKAWVRLIAKHPRVLEHEGWRWVGPLTRDAMERVLVEALPDRALLERAAAGLATLDLGALERTDEAGARLARESVTRLEALLRPLNRLWWFEGFLEGLAEHGAASFAQLAAAGSRGALVGGAA